jgi:hypothetical protein
LVVACSVIGIRLATSAAQSLTSAAMMMLVVDDGLSVVTLVERPVGGLHDPRLRVGEVTLRLRFRCCLATCLGHTFSEDLVVLTSVAAFRLSLRLGTLPGVLFEGLLGVPDFDQPGLAPGKLGWKFVAAAVLAVLGVLGPVDGLGLSE